MSEQLASLLLSGLSTGSVYALVALGFNVIFKSTDAINFAQGEWVMMGGMVAATSYAAKVPLGLALVAAVVCVVVVALLSALLGWLVAHGINRRLARLTAVAGVVATTGRLDVDVPTDGRDETGQLGRALSGMLSALHTSRETWMACRSFQLRMARDRSSLCRREGRHVSSIYGSACCKGRIRMRCVRIRQQNTAASHAFAASAP